MDVQASRASSSAASTSSSHHSEEVLASASFMPRSALEASKLTPEIINCALPLVRELAQLYRVPLPKLALVPPCPGLTKVAWYSARTHVITLTADCKPRDLLGILFHEFNHIGQFKAIIAATLADARVSDAYDKKKQEFFKPMIEAVKEQQLDRVPLYVGIGRLFAASHLQVWQAQEIEARTMDIDEYMEMRAVYRNSLLELTATVSELDANLWWKERLREDSLAKLQKLDEKRCEIPRWALLTGLRNRFALWVEERRSARLLGEIDALSQVLARNLEDVAHRFSFPDAHPRAFDF
jgi:hypothetical protein